MNTSVFEGIFIINVCGQINIIVLILGFTGSLI